MPLRILRFCEKCLTVRQTLSREVCEVCAGKLLPFLDDGGAISRDFLVARGTCCANGCRNCPYPSLQPPPIPSAVLAQSKHCPKCGGAFDCCTAGGCWCESVRLTPNTLKRLERTFEGCLCPSCLQKFSTV